MNNFNKHRIGWTFDNTEYFAIILCTEQAEILEQGKSVHPNQKDRAKTSPKMQEQKQEKEECSGCGKNATPEQIAKRNTIGLTRLVRGAAGMLKAELGIGSAEEKVVAMRKEQCGSCSHYDFGVCTSCGCFCAAKVLLKSETCPKGKW